MYHIGSIQRKWLAIRNHKLTCVQLVNKELRVCEEAVFMQLYYTSFYTFMFIYCYCLRHVYHYLLFYMNLRRTAISHYVRKFRILNSVRWSTTNKFGVRTRLAYCNTTRPSRGEHISDASTSVFISPKKRTTQMGSFYNVP